ncbi:alkaline phosphatase D family protein [Caulobacter endophyticus]|uniref:alkaline phosphatase D family protein n=1 Tax=Caulobacter endophyticus TaxID=2172652 RepID=UPI002410193F|nr:alkaline phosphatase D family protein [Caulobacter endophyticus]MDG2529916.1 alkaline phosphatase D family protein [Caulobacter endophyticus]
MSRLTRRGLVAASAALALARADAVLGLEMDRRAGLDPFALGVASGDPGLDGFVLWTRLSDHGAPLDAPSVPVTYEVAEDEAFARIVRRGRRAASPGLAHAVHVEISGLRPGRPYWYRFQALGAVSPVGRTVTAPRRAQRARIAVASCQHFELGWFTAYRDLVAAEPDLVVQLGDYIYENSYAQFPKVRTFDGPEPVDLAGYRRRHALYKSDRDLREAHRATPWAVTWDDHEVENDYADLANLKALEPSVFARRRAAAYQAYFEHMPVRPSLWARPDGPRLHRRLAWGDLVGLPILDGRQRRSIQACNAPRQAGNRPRRDCAELEAPGRTMLGAAQEAWLADGLKRETARWTLLAQQTPVAPIATPEGVMSDQWDGYPVARRRLIDGLTQPAVRNAVILSGDVHAFIVADLHARPERPETPVVATELVTTCLAASHAPRARYGQAQARNPHLKFADIERSGYLLLDVRPDRLEADLRAVSDQGDPDGKTASLARFAVEDGQPGARRG